MTDTELIAATLAAQIEGWKTGSWVAYEELKIEFFRRLSLDPALAEAAIKAAKWAGLSTF